MSNIQLLGMWSCGQIMVGSAQCAHRMRNTPTRAQTLYKVFTDKRNRVDVRKAVQLRQRSKLKPKRRECSSSWNGISSLTA